MDAQARSRALLLITTTILGLAAFSDGRSLGRVVAPGADHLIASGRAQPSGGGAISGSGSSNASAHGARRATRAAQDPSPAKAVPAGLLARHAQPLPAAAPGAVLVQRQAAVSPEVDLRPSEGGEPVIVKFGVIVKKLLGIDPRHGMYTADVVLTLRWKDTRASSVVRAGAQTYTISPENAAKKIWMPDIAVTNREIKGQEVISTGIEVSATGDVVKTQRMIVICTNRFNMASFPFDTQTLKIRLASSTLMMEDLQLVPIQDENLVGVTKGLLGGSDLRITEVKQLAYSQVDGSLHKSRGELQVLVMRKWWVYMRTTLLPRFFLVAISWTVFYLPLKPFFAMPRVATSLISFLALLMLSSKPLGAKGQTWLDVFEDSCCTMLLLTAFSNIFVEIVHHSLDKPKIAGRLDYELKLFWPLVAFIVYVILFISPFMFDPLNVSYLSIVTRAVALVCPVAFILLSLVRYPEIRGGFQQMHKKNVYDSPMPSARVPP